MVNRTVKLMISFLFIVTSISCAKENDNNLIQSKDFSSDLNTVSDFEIQNASDLLKDSKALPHLEGAVYTPLALNEDKIVFGEAVKEDDSITLTQLDIQSLLYEDLYQAKTGRISIMCVSNNYVIFTEYDQFSSIQEYYCLELATKKVDMITSIDNFHPLVQVEGVIKDDKAYVSLLNNDGFDNIYYMYEYDMVNHSLSVIDKNNSGFPVIYDSNLYYLQIDNQNLETYLIYYNLKNQEREVLAYGNEKDGYFHNLTSDGEHLILQVTKGYINSFYEVHPNDKTIEGYVQIPGVDAFTGYQNHFTWTGGQLSDERMRPQYYLLNSQKEILYHYNDSILYPTSKGILWTKFLITENEIPKGEIFHNENSQLMWFEYDN